VVSLSVGSSSTALERGDVTRQSARDGQGAGVEDKEEAGDRDHRKFAEGDWSTRIAGGIPCLIYMFSPGKIIPLEALVSASLFSGIFMQSRVVSESAVQLTNFALSLRPSMYAEEQVLLQAVFSMSMPQQLYYLRSVDRSL